MITYLYNVTKTDPDLKMMEVEYSADGFQTITVGVPFPTEGADLEAFFAAYSPVHIWHSQTLPVMSIPPGMSGVLTYDPTPPPAFTAPNVTPDPTQIANAQMWDQVVFEQKVAAALVKFNVLTTDPTAIPTTTV